MPHNNKNINNQMPAYEITGVESGHLNFQDYSGILKEYGVVIFRKFFQKDRSQWILFHINLMRLST